eukprot:Hpha_TRINITY_DN11152_c0_g1::TRINITY_DN11152_c0_g1_i1::g.27827::m.27827
MRRISVPTSLLLVITTLVSTGVSVGGGLILYFDGLQAIEDTVGEVAGAETRVAAAELGSYFDETAETANRFMTFYMQWAEYETLADVQEMQHVYGFSTALDARRVLGTGLVVTPNVSEPDYMMYNAILWEPLTNPTWIAENNGSDRLYTTALHAPGQPQDLPGPDGNCGDFDHATLYCVSTSWLWPQTGAHRQRSYNFTARRRLEDDPFPWSWQGVFAWAFSDGTPMLYATYTMTARGLPVRNPLMRGHVEFNVYMSLYDWTEVMKRLVATGDLVAADLTKGMVGAVYASSWGAPIRCGSQLVWDTDCVHTLETFDERTRLAAIEVNKTSHGTFMKRSINGADIWLMRQKIFQGGDTDLIKTVDLLWMRDTASVQGRVLQSLLYFLGFILFVTVFDCVMLMFEISKLAVPLRKLADTLKLIHDMDVDAIDKQLDSVEKGQSVIVKDLVLLIDSFRHATASLRLYRDFVPHYVLWRDTTFATSVSSAVVLPQPLFLHDSSGRNLSIPTDLRSSYPDEFRSANPTELRSSNSGGGRPPALRPSSSPLTGSQNGSQNQVLFQNSLLSVSNVSRSEDQSKAVASELGARHHSIPNASVALALPPSPRTFSVVQPPSPKRFSMVAETVTRQVSKMVVNVMNSLLTGTERWGQVVRRLVSVLQRSAGKGVLDGCSGDRFWLTWNGTRPTTNSAFHAGFAAARVKEEFTCGVGASEELGHMIISFRNPTDGSSQRGDQVAERALLSIGLAAGEARCGMAGETGFRYMAVVGKSDTFAFALERVAALSARAEGNSTVLCVHRIREDVCQRVESRWYNRVRFRKGGERAVNVWELLTIRNGESGNGEWMYMLQNNDAQDVWGNYNKACALCVEEQPLKALEELGKGVGGPAQARYAALATHIEDGLAGRGVAPGRPWVLSADVQFEPDPQLNTPPVSFPSQSNRWSTASRSLPHEEALPGMTSSLYSNLPADTPSTQAQTEKGSLQSSQ